MNLNRKALLCDPMKISMFDEFATRCPTEFKILIQPKYFTDGFVDKANVILK